jgi:hypothetical protein
MRLPSVSLEALIGIFVGLFVGLVEMNWELRSLGVLVASGLAVHITRRLYATILLKVAIAVIAIGLLAIGTYHQIWASFTDDFPTVTSETAITRIIEFLVLFICAVAAYTFIVRATGLRGYQILPAQLMLFGSIVIAAGFVPLAVGLAWQLRQNWQAGTAPTGAPVALTAGPQPPQIAQAPSPPALPAPIKKDNQFLDGYGLTEEGVRALTTELYKLKDSLKHIDVQRLVTDPSYTTLWAGINKACDRAGIECPLAPGHLNSPDDRGIKIYVADINSPPESAKNLQGVLERLGLHSPFALHPGNVLPGSFILFLGPAP